MLDIISFNEDIRSYYIQLSNIKFILLQLFTGKMPELLRGIFINYIFFNQY